VIYRESIPSFQFSDTVERFWAIEYQGTSDAPVEPVLPDGCPEIVFNLADRFQRIPNYGEVETQASAIVSGQIRSRLLIRPSGRVSLFGVRFRPYGAACFLGVRMSSLTDHVVPLLDVVGSFASELEALIAQASSFEERVSIVESAMCSRPSGNSDASIAAGLTEMISASGGRMPVRELVDRTGISERRVERMFDRHVGVSPKVFSRIVRFRGVVRSIEAADSFGLLDTALSHGYYDQSHMIHEFNEFAGTSPRGYFDQTHRLSELFTS
jgi:AraC-like DNA-binding protein